MHSDHRPYHKMTGRLRLERSINSLVGLIEGVAIDQTINPSERDFLESWLEDHADRERLHPFNELIPVVKAVIADGVLTDEEKEDVQWLCGRLLQSDYFDAVTADMQRLHAVLGGIAADGKITEEELRGLSDWLEQHDHLRTCWPYDEVDSLVTSVLADKRIDEQEHALLLGFFSEFIAKMDDRTLTAPLVAVDNRIGGLCAVCPEITFEGRSFAFTGASMKYTRAQFSEVVAALGGTVLPGVSNKVHYLIIGAEGNPCWTYACYGRKVEKAVELRRNGAKLLLVHENDFHDSAADR